MTARTRNYLWLIGAIVAVWLYGAIHVVYGNTFGIETCWKVGWSLSDTFVDGDLHWSGDDDRPPDKVLDALEKCRLEPDPGAWTRDRDILIAVGLALFGLLGAKAYGRAFPPPKDRSNDQ